MKRLTLGALFVASAGAIACFVAGCSSEQREARYLKRANQSYEKKQFDKAQVDYMNIVRVNPKNVLAWTRLGLIASDKGELQLAYKALGNVKTLQPDNLVARSRLGRVLLSARAMSEARKEALFVLDKDPLNDESMLVLASSSKGAQVQDALQRIEKLPKEASQKPAFHLALAYLHLGEANTSSAEAAFKRVLLIDPSATTAWVGLGTLYWRQNKLKEADEAFKTAAELVPLGPTEQIKWAEFKRGIGAVDEAKRILEEMAAKIPDVSASKIMLAELALEARRFDEARAIVAKLLAKDSRHFQAMFLDAKIKIAEGKLSEGVKALERLADQRPNIPRLQYELAQAEMAINELAKADVAVKEALKVDPGYFEALLLQATLDLKRGNLAPAITLLERMTNRHPAKLNSYFLLAAGYAQRGSPEDALRVYARLSAMAPTNAEVPFLKGMVYRQQKNYAEARRAFSQSLEMKPENVRVIYNLIELDLIEKNFASALQRAESLGQKYPKAPEPLMIIARIHRAQGDIGKAEAMLARVLEVAPEYRPAFFALAEIDLKANRFEAARDKFERILKRNPNDAIALLRLGMLYESKGELDKAATVYEKAVEAQPKSSIARNNLAYVYAERGNTNAYDHAREARNLAPSDPFVADTLGWVLCKRGNYADALPLFQEAAGKQTTSAEVSFHLGTAYYHLGEEKAARTALMRALEIEPEFPGKQETQRELAVLQIDPLKISEQQVRALKAGLIQYPNDPVILSRLADYYERTGATTYALTSYELIYKNNPKSLGSLLSLGRLYASLAQDGSTIEKAMDRSNEARKLAPDDPRLADLLSHLAMKTKEYIAVAEKGGHRSDALRVAERANVFWPLDLDFALALGGLRLEQRDYEGAIRLLREVARSDKADAVVFYQLGKAYYRDKQPSESKTALQQALDLNLKGPDADDARKLLKELR